MATCIVALWVVGCLAKAATLVGLGRRRMLRTYPVLTAALTYSTLRSAYCLGCLALWGWPGYRAAWPATRAPEILLGAAVGLEVIYAMARHYPAPWRVMAIIAAPFGMLGAAAGAGVATLPFDGVRLAGLMAIGRTVYLASSVLVVAGGGALQWVEPRMRPNVGLYARGAAICLVAAAVGNGMMSMKGYWWVAAGQVISGGVPLLGLVVWSRMDARGEWHAPSKVRVMGVGAGR